MAMSQPQTSRQNKTLEVQRLEAELDEVKADRERLLEILYELYVKLDLRKEELCQIALKTEVNGWDCYKETKDAR